MFLLLGLYVAYFTLRQPIVWHELHKRIVFIKAALTHINIGDALADFKKNNKLDRIPFDSKM